MQILLSSFWPTDECHIALSVFIVFLISVYPCLQIWIEHVLIGKIPILDLFLMLTNRKNSENQEGFFLSSSAATAIYILIKIKGQQQINRTRLINLVNFRRFSEKFRLQFFIEQLLFSLSRSAPLPAGSYPFARRAQGVRRIAPERRRQPVASLLFSGGNIQ
jgi:hypothetical protein